MNKKGKSSLAAKIVFALILGILFGIVANNVFSTDTNNDLSKWVLSPVGDMFLRSIKMLVVPLVLCSLICGVAAIGDIKKLGRVGVKTIVYYVLTTAVAISIAMFVANIIRPGVGTGLSISVAQTTVETAKAPFIMDMFVNMIPTNPIDSMVKGDMLQIIVFAIMFGACITLLGEKGQVLLDTITQVNEVLLKMINVIMLTAPIGVFALISKVIMFQGIDVLLPLLKYFLTVILVLAIQLFLVYGGALRILGKVNPITSLKSFGL